MKIAIVFLFKSCIKKILHMSNMFTFKVLYFIFYHEK